MTHKAFEKRLDPLEVRETMLALGKGLPQFLYDQIQNGLSDLHACPAPGQLMPEHTAEPLYHLMVVVLGLVIGFGLQVYALKHLDQVVDWLVLIFGVGVTTGAWRRDQVVIQHHCSHDNFFRNPTIDWWLGCWASAIGVLRNFVDYKPDHTKVHHSRKGQNTEHDDTIIFLFDTLKLPLGVSKQQVWLAFWLRLLSPAMHFRFATKRLYSCFIQGTWTTRACAWLFWGGMIVLTVVFGLWEFWVAFLISMVAYQTATAIRLAGEHLLDKSVQVVEERDQRFFSRTTGGILLSNYPYPHDVKGWSRLWLESLFWLHLILVTVPTRYILCCADVPTHDVHTRKAGKEEWWRSHWIRAAELEAGCPGWMEPYWHFGSIWEAIDANFEAMGDYEPADLMVS